MSYKWKPSKAQKAAFRQKMQNPEECEKYEQRKQANQDKKRSISKFDYTIAGGYYKPTKSDYDFCVSNAGLFKTQEEKCVMSCVIGAWACNTTTHHDNIHIVHEKMRCN